MRRDEIPIWMIVPFESNQDFNHYAALQEQILAVGLTRIPLVSEQSDGRYKLLEPKWLVLAFRACGHYKIPVVVIETEDQLPQRVVREQEW